MKQWMKRLVSCALTFVLLCGTALSSSALLAPKNYGDADNDGYLSILDATYIQRYLVKLNEMNKLQEFLADIDGDGKITVLDATKIQRILAGIEQADEDRYITWDYYIHDTRLYADYNSGKARVGTPVTFHAEAVEGGVEPYTYAFYIGDPITVVGDYGCVQERSQNNELVYTFTEPGVYCIKVNIYNGVDYVASHEIRRYEVVEPYDLGRPVVVSTVFKDDTALMTGFGPLSVRAEGGDGKYQYMYRVEGCYYGYEKDGFFLEEPVDAMAPQILSTGYIDSDTFAVPEALFGDSRWHNTTIYVTVRDGQGQVSEPVTVYYTQDIAVA